MKLSAGVCLLCGIFGFVDQSYAFVPPSTGRETASTKLSDIPSKLNFEAAFPSWLVENANAASTSLSEMKGFKDTLASQAPPSDASVLPANVGETVNKLLSSLASQVPSSDSLVLPVNVEETVNKLLNSELFHLATTSWHLEAIAVFGFGSALLWFVTSPETFDDAPYESGTTTYSPEKAAEFYAKRPLQVTKRVLKLAFLTGMFNAGVLFDWLILGKLLKDEEYTALKRNEPRRAKVALSLCEKLGPTFIKLGQALSIRTDLIPEAYALELRQLQDAVPPFDSDIAREVLKKELGVSDLSLVFSSLSDKPVASASIGQVYKGTLPDSGKEVAVKVQRPGILAEIALDLHVLRILTPIQTTLQNAANGAETSPEDIAAAISLVDEWGRGFVAETDYRLEAENTINFESAMRKRGLDAVCAPPVVSELVRDKIMVTEWIEGTRLDRDASADVPRLCGVAINAYLTMLLDTGVLHCDPHPGNLLRTTDGKLCILDWGMTLDVPPNLQYALLELIAHINIEDYDAIPQDFINLGFSPDGVTADRLKSSGITEGLTFAFRQLSQGGGPKKIQERVKDEFKTRYGSDLSDEELRLAAREDMIQQMEKQLQSEGVDVQGVTSVMEEMSKRNRELFQLPPYVLYVARAFSTLEGIGLSIDENYAIVQECYPYLARRLFTDRSPRAKRALRAMLGLAEDADLEQTHAAMNAMETGTKSSTLSPSKLLEMSDGFTSYTAATADVDRDGAGQEAAVLEFVKLLVDEEGSTLQDILVEETARLGDAATRSALKAGLVDSAPAKFAANVLRAPRDLLEQSPLASVLPNFLKEAIVDRPAELPDLIESLLNHNEEDEKILSTATELRDILSSRLTSQDDEKQERISSPSASLDASSIRELLADEKTRNLILDQAPGVAALGRRLGAGLLRRAAYRTDRAHALPEDARNQLADINRRLAEALDVEEKESVDA